jgi:hypothetical protein
MSVTNFGVRIWAEAGQTRKFYLPWREWRNCASTSQELAGAKKKPRQYGHAHQGFDIQFR